MAKYRECKETAQKIRQQAEDMVAFADWLETEGVKMGMYDVPYVSGITTYSVYLTKTEGYRDSETQEYKSKLQEAETKSAVRRFLGAIGTCEKEYSDGNLKIVKSFGSGTARLVGLVDRTIACTKRVVKREWVPNTSKGYWNEEVEWDCETPSLLALVKED